MDGDGQLPWEPATPYSGVANALHGARQACSVLLLQGVRVRCAAYGHLTGHVRETADRPTTNPTASGSIARVEGET